MSLNLHSPRAIATVAGVAIGTALAVGIALALFTGSGAHAAQPDCRNGAQWGQTFSDHTVVVWTCKDGGIYPN